MSLVRTGDFAAASSPRRLHQTYRRASAIGVVSWLAFVVILDRPRKRNSRTVWPDRPAVGEQGLSSQPGRSIRMLHRVTRTRDSQTLQAHTDSTDSAATDRSAIIELRLLATTMDIGPAYGS